MLLIGGGSRSPWWAQLIADTHNLPIVTHLGGEAGGALGAARLGWLATGGAEAEVCKKPDIQHRHIPDAVRHQQLMPRLSQFRLLYQQQVLARKTLN